LTGPDLLLLLDGQILELRIGSGLIDCAARCSKLPALFDGFGFLFVPVLRYTGVPFSVFLFLFRRESPSAARFSRIFSCLSFSGPLLLSGTSRRFRRILLPSGAKVKLIKVHRTAEAITAGIMGHGFLAFRKQHGRKGFAHLGNGGFALSWQAVPQS
jgi:hypothetical protein